MSFSDDLKDLLRRGTDLPTLPDVVIELRKALDDDMTGDARIADIIERDPAVTSKLLRVANSVAYSRGVEVGSVLAAVQRVGQREVRSICVVLAVVRSFSDQKRMLDHKALWDHSAAVGRVAQMLARKLELSGDVGLDDVYVAGLLHDVGILLMDQFFHEGLAAVIAKRETGGSPLWSSELEILGMDHGEVGGMLLERWSLPPSIVGCVRGHHNTEKVEEPHRDGCRIVHAAEEVCSALGAGIAVEGPVTEDPFTVLVDLGLDDGEVDSLLTEIEELGVSVKGMLTGA